MNDDPSLPNAATDRPPRTWGILGERAGDNAQVIALCRLLGWPAEFRQIRYDMACTVDFKDRGATLTGIDLGASDRLAAPWPDLIIAIGRRSVPVARWIRAQAPHPVLHVHLGRPRTDLSLFDLVITTPQYNLPDAANVLHVTLPFVHLDGVELGNAAAAWHERFAALPRPWTAVMVGGPTPQLAFGPAEARQLLGELASLRGVSGGSLMVTTSPRTEAEVVQVLENGLPLIAPGKHLFAPFLRGGDNPYQAMLALCDRFVISVDSASMVAESVTREKPIHIFHLPKIAPRRKPGIKSAISRNLRLRRKARQNAGRATDLLDWLYDFSTRRGRSRPRRDIDRFEARLIELGIATPLSDPCLEAEPDFERLREETTGALARIRALWAERSLPQKD